MRNVFFYFLSTIMITGLGLGLLENWPWPWPLTVLALALASKWSGLGLGLEHMLSSNPSLVTDGCMEKCCSEILNRVHFNISLAMWH